MNNPVVLITGALTGIGCAIALSKLLEILIHSLWTS
jgi:NAD(P)-dependent dehydrogenase (short-subunit alcohol dehydrogenase family)